MLLSDDGKEERRERDETERRERATPPVDADTQRLLDDWNAYADDASRAERRARRPARGSLPWTTGTSCHPDPGALLRRQRRYIFTPPLTAQDYLATLTGLGLVATAAELAPFSALL